MGTTAENMLPKIAEVAVNEFAYVLKKEGSVRVLPIEHTAWSIENGSTIVKFNDQIIFSNNLDFWFFLRPNINSIDVFYLGYAELWLTDGEVEPNSFFVAYLDAQGNFFYPNLYPNLIKFHLPKQHSKQYI